MIINAPPIDPNYKQIFDARDQLEVSASPIAFINKRLVPFLRVSFSLLQSRPEGDSWTCQDSSKN